MLMRVSRRAWNSVVRTVKRNSGDEMIANRLILQVLIVLLASPFALRADERVVNIPNSEFERLQLLIRPQQRESPWREIAWLTNVTEAREKAAAAGKPIVIFTAADGRPLGRT